MHILQRSSALAISFVLPMLVSAGQICRPAGYATGLNSDQNTELNYGPIANAMLDKCAESGAMQRGFSVENAGWYAQFTGCSEMGSACTDIMGNKGGQGGDYQKLVDSCKTPSPPALKAGYKYNLAAAPDQHFHGGVFEHIFQPTGRPCGLLIVDRGSPK